MMPSPCPWLASPLISLSHPDRGGQTPWGPLPRLALSPNGDPNPNGDMDSLQIAHGFLPRLTLPLNGNLHPDGGMAGLQITPIPLPRLALPPAGTPPPQSGAWPLTPAGLQTTHGPWLRLALHPERTPNWGCGPSPRRPHLQRGPTPQLGCGRPANYPQSLIQGNPHPNRGHG